MMVKIYVNKDEITKKSFDYMLTDLNNLHLNCQGEQAGNSVNSLKTIKRRSYKFI